MTKILAINSGSSSLKFQLFEMPEEKVITKGLVERIGIENSVFTIEFNGEKNKETLDIPNHDVAIEMLLEKLTKLGIVQDVKEIEGVGHRVVHGGEFYDASVLVTDDVNFDNNISIATSWLGMSTVSLFFSPLNSIVNTLFSIPILSTNPFVITFSSGISNNWNFKDELPELIASIFVICICLLLLFYIIYYIISLFLFNYKSYLKFFIKKLIKKLIIECLYIAYY